MPHGSHEQGHHHDRHGARQPERFKPSRAAMLNDRARLDYLPAETILALLDAAPGATVLDFGAGTGFYAEELLRLRPDLRIVAVDEQDEMLAQVRTRAERAGFRAGGPALVEQAGPDVARVLAINVLHEIGDADLERLFRLVNPAAAYLFIDWDAAVAERPGPPADHVYQMHEAAARLETLGLAIDVQTRLTYHYALRGHPRDCAALSVPATV